MGQLETEKLPSQSSGYLALAFNVMNLCNRMHDDPLEIQSLSGLFYLMAISQITSSIAWVAVLVVRGMK